MRLNIKATDIALNDDIREYLNKKLLSLSKIIDLEDEAVLVAAELGRTTRHHQTGPIFRAEINIYRGKESFRASAEAEDLNAAIDMMREEIAHKIASSKGKYTSLVRRGGHAVKELMRGGYTRVRGLRVPKNLLRPWRWMDKDDDEGTINH
ncbi:MAG: HPF/RaiA family ribosome-associated protein [bacterium]|nr:HPF/RaiA family ribosome-associated protein [bacterium]